MGNIVMANGNTPEQEAALAQINQQEQAIAMMALGVASQCLAVTLKHELEVAEANEHQRREAEYRKLVAAKKAELGEEFANDDAQQAALLGVPFPPKQAQYPVNVQQAVNVANQVAALFLQSRGLPVAPFAKV